MIISDDLLSELYHSIAIYSACSGAPHLVKLPDLIESAVKGDKTQFEEDAYNIANECIISLIEPYINMAYELDNDKSRDRWKSDMTAKLKALRETKFLNKLNAKNIGIEILNAIMDKMGSPKIQKLEKK